MKKTFRFVLAAFAIVAAASCAQELEGPVTDVQQDVELVPLTISVAGEMTKTTVGEDGKTINWCADDKIAVFDGVAKREFTIVDGTANGKTASFQGLVAKDAVDFHAVYPYESAVAQADGLVTVNAVSEQVLDGGNVADGAILAVTSFKKGAEALSFSNAVGFLRVDVSYEDVTEVIVCGTGIAGTASFNAAGELEALTAGESTVSLLPAGEVFAPGSYYVTLLPGTTPAGAFTVTLVRKGDTGVVMTAAKEVAVPRNAGFFVADTKLSETFIIKDAATLQTFLAGAKDYQAGQSATVVKDIDLAGVELASAESFAGVLNGNGRSLKNWTSAGVSLFTEVSGSVNYLTLDASCSLAPADAAGAFGFVAETVAAGGAVNGCVNNADITFAPAQWAAAGTQEEAGVFFGTIVGQNNGSVHGCVNNGDLNITAATSTVVAERGWVYLGGVVGRMDNATQIAADATFTGLSDCVNNGDLTYTVDGMSGYVFIGGVTGGTAATKLASSTTVKANIVGCENTGNVYYTFDNGGSMENGVDLAVNNKSSNYINLGGVAGYTEGNVRNCSNGILNDPAKGKVDVVAPVCTIGYSAARVAVAGVAGYVMNNVTECDNFAPVYIKGSFHHGGGVTYLGTAKETGVMLAGVIAQCGPYSNGQNFTVSDCHNYGAVTADFLQAGDESSIKHYAGGVGGDVYTAMSACTNQAPVVVNTTGSINYLGGVAGYIGYDASNLENKAEVKYNFSKTDKNHLGGNCYAGGVVGWANVSYTLSNSVNNADFTVNVAVAEGQTLSRQFRGAGVAGTAGNTANLTNNGTVAINECSNSGSPLWAGVVAVPGSDSSANLTNNGKVVYNGDVLNGLKIGGVVAMCSSKAVSDCENTKPVSVTATDLTGTLTMGGVIADCDASGTVTGLKNIADLTTNVGNTAYIGGVVGDSDKGKTTYSKVENNGNIVYNIGEKEATKLVLAGICAFSYDGNTYSECKNTGKISVTAAKAGTGYLSGIVGYNDSATKSQSVENCENTGDLYAKCPATWYVGGVLSWGGKWSSSNQSTLKDNKVSCKIQLDCATDAHYIGGMAGMTGLNHEMSGNEFCGSISVGSTTGLGFTGGMLGATYIKPSGKYASSAVNGTQTFIGNTVDVEFVHDGAKSYCGLLLGGIENQATYAASDYAKLSTMTVTYGANTVKSTTKINGNPVTVANLDGGYSVDTFTLTVTGTENVIFQ